MANIRQLSGQGNLTAREFVPIGESPNLGGCRNNIAPVSRAQQDALQRPQVGTYETRERPYIGGAQPITALITPSNPPRSSTFYNDIARHIIKTFPYQEFAKSHNCEVEDVRLAILRKVVQPMLDGIRALSAREGSQSRAQAPAQAQSHLYAQAPAQVQFQTPKYGYNTNVVQPQGNGNPPYVPPYFQAPIRMIPVDPNIIDPALVNPIPTKATTPDGPIALTNPLHETAPQATPDPVPETSAQKRQMSGVEIVDLSTAASTDQQGTPSKRPKISPSPETANTTPAPPTAFTPMPTPKGYAAIGHTAIHCSIPETTSISGTATATAATPISQPIVIDDDVPEDLPTSLNGNHPAVVHNLTKTRSESEEPLAIRTSSLRKAANGSSGQQGQIAGNKMTVRRRNLYDIATERDKEIWKKHVLDPHLRKSGKGGENLVNEGKYEAEVPEKFDLLMR